MQWPYEAVAWGWCGLIAFGQEDVSLSKHAPCTHPECGWAITIPAQLPACVRTSHTFCYTLVLL